MISATLLSQGTLASGSMSLLIIAELICVEGTQAEPHTLENLLTHHVTDRPYFCLTCVRLCTNTLKNMRVAPYHRHIFDFGHQSYG